MLQLRDYQERSLEQLSRYLREAQGDDPADAFARATGMGPRSYQTVRGLETAPYVCLRVPTGGGKTLMACHALGRVLREYLLKDRTIALWLVPSNAIREQTLKALKDRRHPYFEALEASIQGEAVVMDLQDALSVPKADLDGATCIIVTTFQALRVEDTEGRRVYSQNGALHSHFSGLNSEELSDLENGGGGSPVYSLANLLRLHKPLIIVDEAHNARTKLSFDTLARFRPSCIVEFTATPEMSHNPDAGRYRSNILHQVSARELKLAEMVKLPIKLRTRSEWIETVSDAVQMQRNLESIAIAEEKDGGGYLRPLVLLQAQSVNGDDVNVEALKQALMADFQIPEERIAIATGTQRELRDVNLMDRDCPIRFIITVRALVEGWDCSFAYILCTISNVHTSTAVEQVLGRILRMPHARRKVREELNCAYAFAASDSFVETAKSLTDALIEAVGFQKLEAKDLVTPAAGDAQGDFIPSDGLFEEISEQVSDPPRLEGLSPDLFKRVSFDPRTQTVTVRNGLSPKEKEELLKRFDREEDKAAVERIYRRGLGLPAIPPSPARPATFELPLLAIRIDGQLELLEEAHFLERSWNVAAWESALTRADIFPGATASVTGEIDVSDQGRLQTRTVHEAPAEFFGRVEESGWTPASLANWLDRAFAHPDIPQGQSSLYIHKALTRLIEEEKIPLEMLARYKFRLARALEEEIDRHRSREREKAFQATLFGDDAAIIEVSPDFTASLRPETYAPGWYYDGGYRFQKHLFGAPGELKSEGEEFECACRLDQHPNVTAWLRNLERRPDYSFYLQTATDRFYPDFLVELKDGRKLVVEYKGADRWTNDDSKEKRAVGELWAERSGGLCLFIMPKGPDWQALTAIIESSPPGR